MTSRIKNQVIMVALLAALAMHAFGQGMFQNLDFENGVFVPAPTPGNPAVTHVDEPTVSGLNNAFTYFNFWARGKSFGIAAWNSRRTERFQAVGDPFVIK